MEHLTMALLLMMTEKSKPLTLFHRQDLFSVAVFISISKGKSAVDIITCTQNGKKRKGYTKNRNWIKIVIKMHGSVSRATPSVPIPTKCLSLLWNDAVQCRLLCALRHVMRETLVNFLWICRHFIYKINFFLCLNCVKHFINDFNMHGINGMASHEFVRYFVK